MADTQDTGTDTPARAAARSCMFCESAKALTYTKYLKVSMRLQRAYIRGEQRRIAKARRLFDLYKTAMGRLQLHPLTDNEIDQRRRELEVMLANVAKTHGDNETQRIHHRMLTRGA